MAPFGAHMPAGRPTFEAQDAALDKSAEHALLAITNANGGSKWVAHDCSIPAREIICRNIALGDSDTTSGRWIIVILLVDRQGCYELTRTNCDEPMAAQPLRGDPTAIVSPEHLRSQSETHEVYR